MRINKIYTYFSFMKTHLNLTIEKDLLSAAKLYAQKNKTSVSELVENHFKTITRPGHRENIITLVEKLDKPVIDPNADLKDIFYSEQAKKYGF